MGIWFLPAFAADITNPGDIIQGVPNDGVTTGNNFGWPAGEAPQYVIDNQVGTKFLHFKGEIQPTGFRVTPSRSQTIAGGMTFTTANDAAERDPIKWELYGSNTSIDGPYSLIASGDIVDFSQATAWARQTKNSTQIRFINTTAYNHYQVMFPAIRNPGSANSMQIAEVEILEAPENGWVSEVRAGNDRLVRLPNNTLNLAATISDFDTPIEAITHTWVQDEGPGTVAFNGTEGQLDATATFPAVAGLYSLRLQVEDDMGNDANDIIQVRVWDPAAEDLLIGHWTFNEGSGTIANDSSGNNNKGILSVTTATLDETTPTPSAPTYAPGWIPSEAPNNYGLKFVNGGYVEIKTDPNYAEGDLNNLQWSISISAWMKADDYRRANGEFANRRILQKGASDNQFRLLAEWGNMVFHLAGVGRLETPLPPAGTWHHIAATYDGNTMKMFVDGWLAGSLAATGRIGISQDPLFLGTKSGSVTVSGDYFKGMLEDLRICNYPLSDSEIQALAAEGENVPPVLSLVDPADLVLSIRDSIQMDATVVDFNNDTIHYMWTASDPSVSFDPSDSVEDPKAVFTKAGTYILRLEVNDGIAGLDHTIFAEVTVEVTNPGCADVIAAGLALFGDANEDCHVNLEDFAIFAANWLQCNDPLNPNCVNPFKVPKP